MNKFLFALLSFSFCLNSALGKQTDTDDDANTNATKIWIDGTDVVIAGTQGEEKVAFDALESKLASLGGVKEFWFHEHADSREVIIAVAPVVYKFARKQNIPLTGYFDRDFKKLAYRVKNQPVTVEGDAALLATIRDTNKKYHEELNHGHFEGSVTRDGDTATIDFKWSGDNLRIGYDAKSLSTRGGRGESGIAIRTPRFRFIYFASRELACHYENVNGSFFAPMRCHPKKLRYTFRESIPWAEVLDHENPRGDVAGFKITEGDDSTVIIERFHPGDVIYKITVSRLLGNRITEFTTSGFDANGSDVAQQIEWVQNKEGEFYPKQYRLWRWNRERPRGEPNVELKLSHFEACPISEREFVFRQSDFPPETKFKYFGQDGRELDKDH